MFKSPLEATPEAPPPQVAVSPKRPPPPPVAGGNAGGRVHADPELGDAAHGFRCGSALSSGDLPG